eukprot:724088-Pelagomonas_calceolata.AAC.1
MKQCEAQLLTQDPCDQIRGSQQEATQHLSKKCFTAQATSSKLLSRPQALSAQMTKERTKRRNTHSGIKDKPAAFKPMFT